MTCQGKGKARAKQVKGPRLRPPVCCKLGGIAGDVATQGFRVDGVAPGRDGVDVNDGAALEIERGCLSMIRRSFASKRSHPNLLVSSGKDLARLSAINHCGWVFWGEDYSILPSEEGILGHEIWPQKEGLRYRVQLDQEVA
jgi:hypothetical protein